MNPHITTDLENARVHLTAAFMNAYHEVVKDTGPERISLTNMPFSIVLSCLQNMYNIDDYMLAEMEGNINGWEMDWSLKLEDITVAGSLFYSTIVIYKNE